MVPCAPQEEGICEGIQTVTKVASMLRNIRIMDAGEGDTSIVTVTQTGDTDAVAITETANKHDCLMLVGYQGELVSATDVLNLKTQMGPRCRLTLVDAGVFAHSF